jgi:N-acetylmuramoyl-L-alanine amidase
MEKTILLVLLSIPLYAQPYTIMLNPAGNAQTTGRHIHDTFERSYTLRLAEQIKKSLEQEMPYISTILTRLPGEVAQPLQYANFANRVPADLYLSIHCFQEESAKPRLYIYQFSYGEAFALPKNSLSFYTYDQAHLLNLNTTTLYGNILQAVLVNYAKLFDVQGPYKIPFAPLIGITCPAFGIEIGLKNNNSWADFAEPLVEAITTIMVK